MANQSLGFPGPQLSQSVCMKIAWLNAWLSDWQLADSDGGAHIAPRMDNCQIDPIVPTHPDSNGSEVRKGKGWTEWSVNLGQSEGKLNPQPSEKLL